MNLELSRKRVLVTGGTGFLGKAVVRELDKRGANLITPSSRDCNLVDRAQTAKLFTEHKPEVVFHLAARVGGIGANQKNPGAYFYENLQMGLNVIEEARLNGVEKTVVAGTICAYPKFTPVPFREDELWNGYPEETNAPYGVAKKALLVMSQAYRQQYGFNSIVLFPVNLYGPEDNFDLESSHVIPAMIRKFLEAKASGTRQVVLWGDGSPTREFLYVDDCARGLVLAAEQYASSDPVNLGAGFEISMRDLATLIGRLTGYDGDIVWDTSRPNGQPRRMLDVTRARERFGFEAAVGFEQGLRNTIAWYTREKMGQA